MVDLMDEVRECPVIVRVEESGGERRGGIENGGELLKVAEGGFAGEEVDHLFAGGAAVDQRFFAGEFTVQQDGGNTGNDPLGFPDEVFCFKQVEHGGRMGSDEVLLGRREEPEETGGDASPLLKGLFRGVQLPDEEFIRSAGCQLNDGAVELVALIVGVGGPVQVGKDEVVLPPVGGSFFAVMFRVAHADILLSLYRVEGQRVIVEAPAGDGIILHDFIGAVVGHAVGEEPVL